MRSAELASQSTTSSVVRGGGCTYKREPSRAGRRRKTSGRVEKKEVSERVGHTPHKAFYQRIQPRVGGSENPTPTKTKPLDENIEHRFKNCVVIGYHKKKTDPKVGEEIGGGKGTAWTGGGRLLCPEETA